MKHFKSKVMYKLQLVERLSIIFMIAIFMSSCKKEHGVNKDIDLTDADIRINRVEIYDNSFNPPFLSDAVYKFRYDYEDNSTVIYASMDGLLNNFKLCEVSYLSDTIATVDYKWPNTNEDLLKAKKYLYYYNGLYAGVNYVYSPVKSLFEFTNKRITSVKDTFEAGIYFGYDFRGNSQYRQLSNIYIDGKIQGVESQYDCNPDDIELLTKGKGLNITDIIYDDNHLVSYKLKSMINRLWPDIEFTEYQEWILNEPAICKNLNVSLNYTAAPGVPKQLIKMVNQALGGYMSTAISDDIITVLANFDKNSIWWKEYINEVKYPTSKFDNDWILTFSDKNFSVIPEQDKLISSKRVQGQFLTNVISRQPIYKSGDITTTFPYTHDPVAKTLEIAGLKIWYEVVD